MHFCFIDKNLQAIAQLNLAMLLDRSDIARTNIFLEGKEWQVKKLFFN